MARLRDRLAAGALAALLGGVACVASANAQDGPRTSMRVLFQTTLTAGLAHHEAKAHWDALRVGDPIGLVREPANAHDANAVRVEWRGHLLGYVPRADNADVARQLDRGTPLQARIRSIAKYRNHRRKLEIEIFAAL